MVLACPRIEAADPSERNYYRRLDPSGRVLYMKLCEALEDLGKLTIPINILYQRFE